jgi:hypothetical protein
MPSKLTATLAVRITPEAEQLRRELQQTLNSPANKVVEEALRHLKTDLTRCGASEQAAA